MTRTKRRPTRQRKVRATTGENGMSVRDDYRRLFIYVPPRVHKAVTRLSRETGVTMNRIIWQAYEHFEEEFRAGRLAMRDDL